MDLCRAVRSPEPALEDPAVTGQQCEHQVFVALECGHAAYRHVQHGHDGAIVGGKVVQPGTGQEEAAAGLLADDRVAFLQTRNVVHGCYMLTIRRNS